jgi:Protein of unknown function (DUF2970)
MSEPVELARKPSFMRSLVAVMWSFFGVRKGSEFQEDIARVSMMHLIVIGIGAGFLFVIGLMLFVRWVVAH